MAYAQKNYNFIQGIRGIYRWAAIGCFGTAICNLIGRAGRDISPVEFNDYFVKNNLWRDVDDGCRDDLWWEAITAIEPRIVVSRIVDKGASNRTAGWPTSNNAIVRFWYQSKQTGQYITHFALVHDAKNKTILDSWDGVVKQNPYGEPTAFAEYALPQPQPVAPVPSAILNAATPQPQPGQYRLQVGEGISHAAKNMGWPDWDQPSRWEHIALINERGRDWNTFNASLNPGQIINVGIYTPPVQAPAPLPTPEPVAPVTEQPKPKIEVVAEDFRNTFKPGIRTDRAFKQCDIYDELTGTKLGTILPGDRYDSDGTFVKEKDGKLVTFLRRKYKQYEWVGVPGYVLKPYNDELHDDDLTDDFFSDIDMDDGETIIPHMTDEQRKQARHEKRVRAIGKVLGVFTSVKNIFNVFKKNKEQ